MYWVVVMLAPAGLTATRNVVPVLDVLHTLKVEQIALVAPGTVYRVVSVAADGLICPSTL
jgi:hypothetical protein